MRLKLFLLLLLSATVPMWAQNTGLSGVVVDATTGSPIPGASVMLAEQGIYVTTGPAGDFRISGAAPGEDLLSIVAYGYRDYVNHVSVTMGHINDLGIIRLSEESFGQYDQEDEDLVFDESDLDNDEGANQSIGTLLGATDNVYYSTASYNFQPMYFRVRGYDSRYDATYINGIEMNDPSRGRFNYWTIGGMNRAFRNKTTVLGMDASSFSAARIGSSTNINTLAADYAPGFNGSVSYSNGAYMLRAMATYATGVNKHGWAFVGSISGRYAKEGIMPGSFYNALGLMLGAQKVFNPQHSLALTFYMAPMQSAGGSPTFEECYELADNYLYNPNWGWQDGKKRAARITERFAPTGMINWVWTPSSLTKVNTGMMVGYVHNSRSQLNWGNNVADPRPDYYRNLPSWYASDPELYELYTDLWRNDESMRQLNWDAMYQANYLNNMKPETPDDPFAKSASYMLENQVTRQMNFSLGSTINHRVNDILSLQGGLAFRYAKTTYFKTVRDLLGAEYWVDIDKYSERDFPDQPGLLQNDMRNPNRIVREGDKFGWDYDIHYVNVSAWMQNMINLPKVDINYGLKFGFTQYYRDGHMVNGRAPENSYGHGATHKFDNAGINLGVTYKADGRNFFAIHGLYETRAPQFENVYISPRTKDGTIPGLSNERVLSGDISYNWAYRKFRGSLSAFWTNMYNLSERFSYYDDRYGTFLNYALTNVRQTYKGFELGMAYKITPSLTATFAGTYARYQYKNRPTGVRSYENGQEDDVYTTVYLKNYFVGGTPQAAGNLGIDWAAPGMWFFNVNASLMGDAYVNVSPQRHEMLPEILGIANSPEELESLLDDLTAQEKLNDAFVLNASVGKLIYLNRRVSLNINVSATNLLNNRKIQTYGYQQGRLDTDNYTTSKFPNKYNYAQGIRIFANVGVRF